MKKIEFRLGRFKDVHFMDYIEVIEKDNSSITFRAKSDVSYILTSKDGVNYKKERLNYCEVQLPDKDKKHEVFPYIFQWFYPGADCCSAGELTCEISVPELTKQIRPYR